MNGAHALLATMRTNGVTTVFANPGTSEMHFVAALDDTPDVRAVLCLFEGVATGAADGYARVTGRAAATLLHLGPGLANGWANLHNARRARVPLLNVIGDHATYHAQFDAPLQSDIAAVAGALDGSVRNPRRPDDVAGETARAIADAYGPPSRVATLILPADVSWGELEAPPTQWPLAASAAAVSVDEDLVDYVVMRLRTTRSAILLGGAATTGATMDLAHRVGAVSGATVMVETFPTSMDRGAGVFQPERLIYLSEFAVGQLAEIQTLVLVGASEPIGFFAYPDVPSRLAATNCDIVALAPPGRDVSAALETLADRFNAPRVRVPVGRAPEPPSGALNAQSFAAAIAATLPEGAVISDESNTSGIHLYGATTFAAPHRLLTLTGGSIGFGLPVAVGAAIGSGARVIALESDGSMMYTLQALWTMAREGLDVTVVALSNRRYAILDFERQRVGATGAGEASERLLSLDDPDIDLCGVARALGVPARAVTTADELVDALRRSFATAGPSFIEVPLASAF
ncbi:MAG: acetolactate synthase large subunit [Acidimicrobiales bacterium]